ncbi:MAG TPA: rubrerythrin family protein [Syntrophaceae bacterium]|nr:rubrerythrin family protein [Syntrophaceae bacterium]
MELRGSQTEKNLMIAFAGESQARSRYSYYASVARKAGYEQISAIFLETADNEKEHAKVLLKYLQEGDIEIRAAYPAVLTESTLENLKAAVAGENYEWTTMYPDFAKAAKEEGFDKIAKTLTEIAKAEQFHENRYLALIKNLEEDKVFKKDRVVKWHCRNCGYIYEGKEAPNECPACKHPQAYFEVLAENY